MYSIELTFPCRDRTYFKSVLMKNALITSMHLKLLYFWVFIWYKVMGIELYIASICDLPAINSVESLVDYLSIFNYINFCQFSFVKIKNQNKNSNIYQINIQRKYQWNGEWKKFWINELEKLLVHSEVKLYFACRLFNFYCIGRR